MDTKDTVAKEQTAAMARLAGPKCESYDPDCFACAAWRVMPSWFENEQPALLEAAFQRGEKAGEAKGRREELNWVLEQDGNSFVGTGESMIKWNARTRLAALDSENER